MNADSRIPPTPAGDPEGPILVAYDGSPDANAALDWAITEAGLRGCGLRVVYVEHDLPQTDGNPATMSWSPKVVSGLVRAGEPIVAAGVARASAAGIAAEALVLEGAPAGILARRSAEARLLVMGSRGVGSVRGALIGATVPHVASHASCPVVVVWEQADESARVTVGVDGSPESAATLRWAFEYARGRKLALHVLRCFEIPIYPEVVPYVPPIEVIEDVSLAATQALSEEVAAWAADFPDVEVSQRAVQDRPARALVAASQESSLVVVGSHGRGGFTGMLLGSTSQALLHHSACSVAVIHHPRAR